MPSKSLESEVNDSLVFLRNMGKLKIENGAKWVYRRRYKTELLLVDLTESRRRTVNSSITVAVAFVDLLKVFL